jgi:hypothetical protein
MAKRSRKPASEPASKAVTAERKLRLIRLVQLLGTRPQTLAGLMRRLCLDIRGFYRDLELLRARGIAVELRNQRYLLADRPMDALARLPLPDPELTVGEAKLLARGRTAAHRKLKEQIARLERP